MPRGVALTKKEIYHRLMEWRNLKRLYGTARERIERLREENRQLKAWKVELEQKEKDLRAEKQRLEEELRKEQDANGKLRAMLFKTHRHRTKRRHQPQPRSAASYRRREPEHVTEERALVLANCPDCGTPVTDAVSSRTRLTEDIVFTPHTFVTAWTIHRYWCTACEKQVEGTVPGMLPRTTIGPNTLTFVVLAKYRWNQPYTKITDQLLTCFGMRISEGEVAHLIDTAATLVGDKWQEIVQAVKSGQKVHCDETGWYINGQKVWAHAFANDYAVLYEILPSRGKAVVEKTLAGFQGTRITDCLANYKNLNGTHQICWAHLTREAQENTDRDPGNTERDHLQRVFDIIYADLRLATDSWEQASAAKTKRRCETRVQKLQQRTWKDKQCQTLVDRLADFHAALFTCLDYPGIPPDNNHAERVVRKIVMQRKISGGNRSPTHADHHARLMSVIETLRLEGGQLLPKLQAVLQQGLAGQLAGQ